MIDTMESLQKAVEDKFMIEREIGRGGRRASFWPVTLATIAVSPLRFCALSWLPRSVPDGSCAGSRSKPHCSTPTYFRCTTPAELNHG